MVVANADSSAYTPTVVAQVRYMVQWFGEWTEMERGDFMPVLVRGFRARGGAVNGPAPVADGPCREDGRPLSLFKCRIKLFTEWVPAWSDEDVENFLSGVRSADADFAQRYEQNASAAGPPEHCNGVNGDHDGPEELSEEAAT